MSNEVRYSGFLFTAVQNSRNINPILDITDDTITGNSDFWLCNGLSSTVQLFDEKTMNSNTTFLQGTILNDPVNNILYTCDHATGTGQCKLPFTNSNQWVRIGYDIVQPLPPKDYWTVTLENTIEFFTIEEIPGERFVDTLWRIWDRIYSKLHYVVAFIVAIILASFSANDLLHKRAPFRVLAFVYTFAFVAFQTNIGGILFFYYLYRSFFAEGSVFGQRCGMNPLKIYGILPLKEDPLYDENRRFPTLWTYPSSIRKYLDEGQKISNIMKLISHGDIQGYIAHALRIPLHDESLNGSNASNASNGSNASAKRPLTNPSAPPAPSATTASAPSAPSATAGSAPPAANASATAPSAAAPPPPPSS